MFAINLWEKNIAPMATKMSPLQGFENYVHLFFYQNVALTRLKKNVIVFLLHT